MQIIINNLQIKFIEKMIYKRIYYLLIKLFLE